MRSWSRPTVGAVALAAALVVGSAGVSAAAAPPTDTDSVAAAVASASPATSLLPSVERRGDGRFVSQSPGVRATAPADGSGVVALGAGGVAIGLPPTASGAAGVATTNGTIVYRGSQSTTSTAVQIGDQNLRILAVAQNAAQLRGLDYSVSGAQPVLQPDGSVQLVARSPQGAEAIVGVVAAPWAKDADGRNLQTEYLVEGNRLRQVVHTTASTTYPVVADPSVSFGWNVYVKFNRSETQYIATSPVSPKVKYASILCGLVPVPLVAAGCAVVGYDVASSIVNTFVSANNVGRCVQITYPYTWAGMPSGWNVVSC